MPSQRTIVFIDGQNLYHSAKAAWASDPFAGPSAYSWPSYDVEKLAAWLVSRTPGRELTEIRFYTGVPDSKRGVKEKFWHDFWTNKLRYLGSRGVYVYRGRVNPGGQEKGVDVSLATDLIRLTYERKYDTAIIVSQDWDFGPAVKLAKNIAEDQRRFLAFESAFPRNARQLRGVPGTTWVHIEKADYDACRDPREYRYAPLGG
jgi:uncharacterized LabA/DUF88 family protein